MGTKLEFTINPLANSSKSNSFTLHCVDDWSNFSKTGLILKESCQNSMDRNRMLERHNMEDIRRTIQEQEDVFKHQVRELHRLYSVQRMLMDELKMEIKKNKLWNPGTSSGINFHFQGLKDDPSSRERSGSCSGDTMRMVSGIDLERPAVAGGPDEDMSGEVSAVDDQAGPRPTDFHRSTQISLEDSDEENEVELTLSIGNSSGKKRAKKSEKGIVREVDFPVSLKSDKEGNCSGTTTPISSSSATLDQETKQPHWLFQGLSINRT
ncbi:hypothetical protein SLE2022_150460 [Rubroshorea leprosula]